MPNGIAPAFENMFPAPALIRQSKSDPPILAYTSTPFRGLDLLLDAFPQIRNAIPGVRLQVFSGMKPYMMPQAEESTLFGQLYDRCRQTAGVEYIGPPAPARSRQGAAHGFHTCLAQHVCRNVVHRRNGSDGQWLPDRHEPIGRPAGNHRGLRQIDSDGTEARRVRVRLRRAGDRLRPPILP
jgi:hypothetical protein